MLPYYQSHPHDHDVRVLREKDLSHLHVNGNDFAPYCENEHDHGSDHRNVLKRIIWREPLSRYHDALQFDHDCNLRLYLRYIESTIETSSP